MSDSNSAVLQRAYELVEAGQADEARTLVESVLEAEQANPDAWWIYAHAIDDPVKARQALNEVIKLDPEYPGAAELIGVLDAQYPEAAEAAQQATPLLLLAAFGGHGSQPSAEGVFVTEPTPAPDVVVVEDEPSFVKDVPTVPVVVEKPAEKRGIVPWWWYAAAAAVALLLLALFVLLFGRPTPAPGVTETAVAGVPTLDSAAQSAQETQVAAGLATEGVGAESTPQAEVATSAPMASMPAVMATLPLDSFVTLTPAPAETAAVIPGQDATPAGEVPTDVAVVEPTSVTGDVPTDAAGVAPTAAGESPTEVAGVNLPDAVIVIVPADTLTELVSALSAVRTPPDSVLTTEATPLGETLVAGFCTTDGPELRVLTRQVMDTVAAAAPVMADTSAAVGVRAVDCSTGQTLRLIVVDRGAATLYTQGEINSEGFESQWISL